MEPVTGVPLWSIRARARACRIAFIAAATVLALAGLRSLVAAPVQPTSRPVAAPSADLAARALAEDYARAYLTARDDEEPAPWADLRPSDAETWTAVVADRAAGPLRRVITVAARQNGHLTYLAVTVTRGGDRRLAVAGPPAIVGPPATDRRVIGTPEVEVEEPAVRAVATRAVRHYLGRERQNLDADLDRGARVTVPPRRYPVTSTDAIPPVRWTGFG